ncbi:MAG: hypothetical protein ACMUEM_06480 [Flavobacteriales bacterium AspAUS03]
MSRMMIGISNTEPNITKNLLLWVNKLKLDGISTQGAYAALDKINLNLADLALVDVERVLYFGRIWHR